LSRLGLFDEKEEFNADREEKPLILKNERLQYERKKKE